MKKLLTVVFLLATLAASLSSCTEDVIKPKVGVTQSTDAKSQF
jgi:hypothetical protein